MQQALSALMILTSFASCGITAEAVNHPSKPNIIIIFADDQGYADLGCQGSQEIVTPHIDSIAQNGIRCTDGYVTAPQCMPSRAGLLTGRYQQRFGFYDNNSGPLPLSEKTIADRLRTQGYRTGQVGKWHLQVGMESRGAGKRPRHYQGGPELRPEARGFDEYFCRAHTDRSERFYYASHNLDSRPVTEPGKLVETDIYRIDAQTQAALGFLQRNHNQPFFLYLAYFAPHVPLKATEKYLQRFPHIEHPKRRTCAAMISAMDDGVGQILKFLKQKQLVQHTLVVYLSDNGAPARLSCGSVNDPLSGFKGSLLEGGIRIPWVMQWSGVLPAGQVYRKPVISLDLAATALGMAAAEIPPQCDGVDLLPYLTGKKQGEPHPQLTWTWENQDAIRKGPWKVYRGKDGQTRLFNLVQDIQEKTNLLDKHPQIVQELTQKLDQWKATLPAPQKPRAKP